MSALEEAKRAWASSYEGLSQVRIDEHARGFTAIIRAVGEEGVLSARRFAELMRLPVPEANSLFQRLAAVGMQSDEQGNIVGAALTTLETSHRIYVGGKALFAWCALDTLFIPGLLRSTGEIDSTCPSSGEAIRLTVSPERVEACEPRGTWLSVFLPGVASGNQIGPASPT